MLLSVSGGALGTCPFKILRRGRGLAAFGCEFEAPPSRKSFGSIFFSLSIVQGVFVPGIPSKSEPFLAQESKTDEEEEED